MDRLHATPNLTMTLATESILVRDEYLKYERENHGKGQGRAFVANAEDGTANATNVTPHPNPPVPVVCTWKGDATRPHVVNPDTTSPTAISSSLP